MPINCNFVTTVGLTNGERCWINNLHVEKHWSMETIMTMF